jgi:hypothetical protein
MNGGTQLGVYESFEDLFGRKSTLDELIADIRSFKQQSVLWVCAVIAAGMQLWTKIDLQPLDVYQELLSLFFDRSLHVRFIAGYWASEPRRVLFHRRQILLIAKLAILHCSERGLDARSNNTERFGQVLLKANDQFHYGLLAELPHGGTDSARRPPASRTRGARVSSPGDSRTRAIRCSDLLAQMRAPGLLPPLAPRCIEVILKTWKVCVAERPCRTA